MTPQKSKVLKNLCSLENLEDGIIQFEQMLASFKKVNDVILDPSVRDITNMLSNGETFLVDGDSLILNAMGNESYDRNNGGQLLHLIYLCERQLQIFSRKGGHFQVLFFRTWNYAFSDKPTVLLAKSVLMYHLKYNMSCTVHEFDSVCDDHFKQLLEKHKYGFILMDYCFTDKLENIFSENNLLQELIFHTHVYYILVSLSLGIVDMSDVELKVSSLYGFYTQPELKSSKLQKLLENFTYKIKNYKKNETGNIEVLEVSTRANKSIRHLVTVGAAVQYLADETVPEPREEWVKLYLLYTALVEVLPIKFRGCKGITNPKEEFITFVDKLHYHMNCVLCALSNQNVKYEFQYIADLWNGNFCVIFMEQLNRLQDLNSTVMLEKESKSIYEQLLQEVAQFSKISLTNLPQVTLLLEFKERENKDNICKENKNSYFWPAQLVPTSCKLTSEFCKDIMPKELIPYNDEQLQHFITKNANFQEKKHWHSKKTITDHYDRVSDNTKPDRKFSKYRSDQKFSKFMAIYGSSIEGRPISTKTIVSTKTENNKKPEKKLKKNETKQRDSVKKLMQKIHNEADLKKDALDIKMLKEFDEKYQKNKLNGDYKLALTDVNFLVRNVKLEKNILPALLKKIAILWKLWCEECNQVRSIKERNLKYAKELFLTLRDIFKKSDLFLLSEKQFKSLGKHMYQMGLGNIADMQNLPRSRHIEESFSVGKTWVEFQLVELGPDLERVVSTEPDKRVENFIPDIWQRELFDCIDNKQSVLVVAPTSSGKTYASYYCMEKVLREDDDGIVVYVAPTKALVNQVAATVYARFKNKQMPPGKSVYGVFTRDYRTNANNCQILVTVPQCLELLLLSPRRYDWIKNFRYVIFDEIHCLAGQAGGFSWESGLLLIQCPFLALSATIDQPEHLQNWLQNMQSFKKEQDELAGHAKHHKMYDVKLVVYKDRYADLKKYVYNDGEFTHVQPYAYLDEEYINKRGGIPSAITLSPEEVFQLYSTMKSVFADDPQLEQLEPETFFSSCCSKGFITRNAVREYETELKNILKDWASEHPQYFRCVARQLNEVSSPVENGNGKAYIACNFIKFIRKLQNENMLPAIIFSYDRNFVNNLFRKATEHYEYSVEDYKKKHSDKVVNHIFFFKN
ncbi:hypothetical protein L9F63_016454 [Diploptera punctata]|uniref:Helicase ATP-binding domain-containing protein n=1 Tax=Diploptera punctata TaxID=6984 RepID=A0AAD8EHI7_DIPPU|nr:hypothetical protein L9F63_016454 [Diploptera punctata]